MDLPQARWRTSSYTNPNNNNCVEVAPSINVVGVRDTKARDRGVLTVRRATFAALIHAVRDDSLAG